MNLESSYQLSKARIAEPEVSRRAKLYRKFPVKELLKRGWVQISENIEVLEHRFLEFYSMKSMEDPARFPHAAKSTTYDEPSMIKLAWLNRAKQVAKAVMAGKYSPAALKAAIPELKACMKHTEEIRTVPVILAKAGVRLVIIEHIPASKMDGACFWVDSSSPVIALSLRFDRVDNFWFNLFHEIDHVLHGEGKDDPIYEVIEQGADGLPPNEIRANAAASDYCIPRGELDGFVARVSPMFSKQAISGFALRLGIHPGIVVGQLQGNGVIHYSHSREMLEKVRGVVTGAVLTDGFGDRKSTRLNSSHIQKSRMPSSA